MATDIIAVSSAVRNITFLVAPEPIHLLPARTRTAIQNRSRIIRRRWAEALSQGRIIPAAGSVIALPAPKPTARETAVTPREPVLTATLALQKRMIEETGIDSGNPHDAWRARMDAFLASQPQGITLTAREQKYIGSAVQR